MCSPIVWSFTHLSNILKYHQWVINNGVINFHFNPRGTRKQWTRVNCSVSSTIGLITKYYQVMKSRTGWVEHAANMGERKRYIHGLGGKT
jgi:hypothetical protein